MSAVAAIHVAKKQLGLDDDTYRALLMSETGKNSVAKMTASEQRRVIEVLRNQGFKPASKPSRGKAAGPYRGKLQALWIAMWNLGLTRDRTDAGLTAFVRRQTKIDHTRFLIHHDDATAAIEALKDWMAREAHVNWQYDRAMPNWTQSYGYRIAVAQFDILRKRDPDLADLVGLQHWLIGTKGLDARTMDDADWIPVMNALGEIVRKVRK